VKCIECDNITSQGVPPRLARCGLSACREIKQPTGTFFTLEYERQCLQFQPAPDATVAARRAWLAPPEG
jgi:hypothetical protein